MGLLQEALLSVRPYIRFLLIAALVHYLTILCKHMCYFQAGGVGVLTPIPLQLGLGQPGPGGLAH